MPVAVTVNDAVFPATTVLLTGSVVITGAVVDAVDSDKAALHTLMLPTVSTVPRLFRDEAFPCP